MGDILTVHDAAKRFGFSTKYIYAKIQAGELKSLRKQGTTFIDSDDLLPSPYEHTNETLESKDTPSSEINRNETLDALRQQITELKAENTLLERETTPEVPKVIDYLERLVTEQKEQIIQLQSRPQTDPSDQKMLAYLQEVIEQQRSQITELQERLEQSQKEALQAIKEANSRKDEQLKQYIEFLNNSTKELITSIEHKSEVVSSHEEEETTSQTDHDVVDVEIAKEPSKMKVSDYLKAKGMRKKERRHVQQRFLKASFKDQKRFTTIDDELYLYPYMYDYDSLLKERSHKHHKGDD